ncbi:MAG: DUF4031 domain-containing protein [Nocardioides sp.]
MTIFIDPPNAAGHGRMWSHLASDSSYDELHVFARSLGISERGFDGDHYDIPAEWHARVLARGAVPVTSRELVDRLNQSGLRVRKSTRMRPRKPGSALLRPSPVSVGDTVAVVTPSGTPDVAARVAIRIDRLREWGLSVRTSAQESGMYGGLAGTDLERATSFTQAWMAPEVSTVWCAGGGFGSQRVLDLLDWRMLASAQPKWLVGCSDITALHQAVAARLGVVTVYGPGVAGLGDRSSAESVRGVLMDRRVVELHGRAVVGGAASGVLVGGSLTALAASAGTTMTHGAAGSIVVLEDVGEPNRRLDRALTQLTRSGWFAGLRAIACGQFTNCGDPAVVDELLLARLGAFGVPLLLGLPIGHQQPNLAFPLGAPATVDGAGRLVVDG